jgi:hypothetical protein
VVPGSCDCSCLCGGAAVDGSFGGLGGEMPAAWKKGGDAKKDAPPAASPSPAAPPADSSAAAPAPPAETSAAAAPPPANDGAARGPQDNGSPIATGG